jgi:hypothetical protein
MWNKINTEMKVERQSLVVWAALWIVWIIFVSLWCHWLASNKNDSQQQAVWHWS